VAEKVTGVRQTEGRNLIFVWKIDVKSVELSRMTFAYCSLPNLFNGLLYQAVLFPPPPYHDGDVEAEEEGQRHT
jgi:hypothetical protein